LFLALFHGRAIWQDRATITSAHGDFLIFYSGAEILRDDNAANLYDLRLQERYQSRFNIKIRGGALPYNHPAYQLLIFLPLARLDYPTAFLIWGAMNCFFLIGIGKLLLPYVDGKNRGVCASLLFGFFPVAAALWQGQDSILTAFLFAATFVSLKRGRDGLAGCLIALGLYKPHLVIPLAAMFIYTRRWRAVLGFAVTGAALALLSTVMVGWRGTVGYWGLLSWIAENNYSIDPMKMANLRGLLEYLITAAVPAVIVQGLIVAASIAVLVWALSAWKGKFVRDNPMFDLKFAQLVVVTLLLSYHLYVHDLSLLALGLIIMLNGALSPDRNDSTMLGLAIAAFIALSLPAAQLLLQKGLMPWFALLLLAIVAALRRQISLAQERMAVAQLGDKSEA
jgi:hypothetical protein